MRMIKMLILCIICTSAYAANEISMQGYLKAEKGTRKIERSPGTVAITWTGTRYFGPVIYSLTTNEWQFASKGAVGDNGFVWMRNVGSSGSVKVSLDAGNTVHFLVKTNEFLTFRLDPSYVITNLAFIAVAPSTNAVTNDFEVTILED